jgi:hypothetical protein
LIRQFEATKRTVNGVEPGVILINAEESAYASSESTTDYVRQPGQICPVEAGFVSLHLTVQCGLLSVRPGGAALQQPRPACKRPAAGTPLAVARYVNIHGRIRPAWPRKMTSTATRHFRKNTLICCLCLPVHVANIDVSSMTT